KLAVRPTGVWLQGFGARDFVTSHSTSEPATIRYDLVEIAGERWLLRHEVHLLDRSSSGTRNEMVCRGVEKLVLANQAVDAIAADSVVSPPDEDFKPISDQLELQLVLDHGESQRTFSQVFSIR